MTLKTQSCNPIIVSLETPAFPVSQLVAMRRNYRAILRITALAWGVPYDLKEPFVAVNAFPKHQFPPQ
jgi:hypothetical protein